MEGEVRARRPRLPIDTVVIGCRKRTSLERIRRASAEEHSSSERNTGFVHSCHQAARLYTPDAGKRGDSN